MAPFLKIFRVRRFVNVFLMFLLVYVLSAVVYCLHVGMFYFMVAIRNKYHG